MHRASVLSALRFSVTAGFWCAVAMLIVIHGVLLVLLEEQHDLANLLVALSFVAALAGLGQARLHVGFQDTELDCLDGAAHGTQLRKDIDAILALADHALDAFELADGSVEPRGLFGVTGVFRHGELHIPMGGIYTPWGMLARAPTGSMRNIFVIAGQYVHFVR